MVSEPFQHWRRPRRVCVQCAFVVQGLGHLNKFGQKQKTTINILPTYEIRSERGDAFMEWKCLNG